MHLDCNVTETGSKLQQYDLTAVDCVTSHHALCGLSLNAVIVRMVGEPFMVLELPMSK